MKADLRALLLATSGLTTHVGSRIDWGGSAQGEICPRIVLWRIGEATGRTMKGPDSIRFYRVQCDIYAETEIKADDVGEIVRATLDHYRGGRFELITFENVNDTREGGSNEASYPHRVSLDFITRWRAPNVVNT